MAEELQALLRRRTRAEAAREEEQRARLVEAPAYDIRIVRLTGTRPLRVDLAFRARFVGVAWTEADPERVRIAFDDGTMYSVLARTLPAVSERGVTTLWLDWDDSETGKRLAIWYSNYIALNYVVVRIVEDLAGLMRDATGQAILSRLDVDLSTRASEATLQAILSKLDVALSTRASEDTLAKLESRFRPSLLAETEFTLDNSAGSSTAVMQVFDSDVAVPDSGVVTIQIVVDASTRVLARIVRGGTPREHYLNSGNSLAANSWYEFAMSVAAGDALNILVEVPAGTVVSGYAALIHRPR